MCILVVEDDPSIAEFLQLNLKAAGYSVTVAADGLVAMKAFDAIRPNLVTLDLLLPGISGFRLAEYFKRTCPETPVLVVTALAFEKADEVIRAGVDEFFTKPFDPANLFRTIGRYLQSPSQGRYPDSGGDQPMVAQSAERRVLPA